MPLNYRGHIAGLDGLRGTAILAVVLYHAYWSTADTSHWHAGAALWVALTGMGYLGVHLFFVLSGFLITGILEDSKRASHAARHFYLRRAYRILPGYVVTLAILRLTHLVDMRFTLTSILFVVNLGRLVGAPLAQFSTLWSLAVEEQFYLVWPWVLWRCTPNTIWRTILACLLLSPVLRLVLTLRGHDSYFATWANVDYLMYGALVAHAIRSGALHQGNLRRITRWVYAVAVAGMALSMLVWALAGSKLWALVLFNAVGRTPEMLLFMGMLLSCLRAHQACVPPQQVAPARPAKSTHLLSRMPRRFLFFLGYISYGLYLVHMIVFRLYDRYASGTSLGGFEHAFALLNLRALLCSSLSILLAWLSRETLEAWFLRRKPGHRPAMRANMPRG